MRNIRAAVAAFAATGLAAFGALAATGGVANAAQDMSITGCSINDALVGVQIMPTCEAADGTIYNPTSITATVDPSYLQAFVGHVTGIGVEVHYDLVCSVDGHWVTASEHFQANDWRRNTQVVDLQQAVGSPEPNQCTVKDLHASSLASITLLYHRILGFGVKVTGDNGVPGAIWAQYPNSTSGAGSTVCADDTANGNHDTHIQAFQCEQDLADQWLQVSKQLIHNGDCMTNAGGMVKLESCEGGHWGAPNQSWWVHGTPYSAGQITQGNGWCLSAPASGMVDGAHLTVQHCGASGFVQMWKAPADTPVWSHR
jgi:hypothetical protein